jgi:hypothetical protein
MIAIKFWFNVGRRSWTTGRILKHDLPAGYSGTVRLNLKWSERNQLLLLSGICIGDF